jgi:hypothetical protein
MKYDKEESELLELLKPNNAIADERFKSQLKAKMLKKLQPRNPFWDFITGFNIAAVFLISFSILLTSGYALVQLSNTNNVVSTPVASSQEKEIVFSKVIENTSLTALNLLKNENFLSLDKEEIAKPSRPEDANINLITTQIQYTPFSKASRCTSDLIPTQKTTTTLYEYFTDTSIISKVESSNKESITVEFENTPTSFAQDLPVSYSANTNLIFETPSEYQVTEEVRNGDKYYSIKDSIEVECKTPTSFPLSFPVSFASNTELVQREIVLNPDFSISSVNYYLNNTSQMNKLAEVKLSTVSQTISEQDATELLEINLR